MDKEKINKAAEEYQENSNVITENFYPSDIEDAFMAGADWIMQQPLSERLNDAEREKIRAIYAETQEWWAEKPNEYNSTLKVVSVALQDRLESIFGSDLFREK